MMLYPLNRGYFCFGKNYNNQKANGQKAEITYERDASNEISDFDRKVIDKIITAIEKFEEKKPGPTEKVLTFMRQIKKAFRAFSSTLKG